MATCDFPACKREAVKGIYCYDHNRLMGNTQPVEKPSEVKKNASTIKTNIEKDKELGVLVISKKASTCSRKLLNKAQRVFNTYIRKRDRTKRCISCNGEVEQAGHYLTVTKNTALRFNVDNVHGQCIECNCFKHGNIVEYRKGLINRIGEEKVLKLENSQYTVHKWTDDQLNAIIKIYK